MSYRKEFSYEQMCQFQINFVHICNSLSLSVSDFIENSSPFCSMSKNTYYKICDFSKRFDGQGDYWSLRRSLVTKIVEIFNNNIQPEVSLLQLMNTDLTSQKFHRKESSNKLKAYSGIYYCYYLNYEHNWRFGVLHIIDGIDSLSCEAVLGFNSESFIEFRSLLIKRNNIANIKQVFEEIHNKSDYRDRTFYYLLGQVKQLKDSIIIPLYSAQDTFARVISFRRYDETNTEKRDNRYKGGISSVVTTAFSDIPTKFYKMAISSLDYDLMQVLEDLELFLKFDESSSFLIQNNEYKNQKYFRLMMDCASANK